MSSLGKVLSFCLVLAAAAAQPAIVVPQATLDLLARDVDRAESMRAVKNLQRTYAQYSQYSSRNRRPSRNSRIVHVKDLLQVRTTVYKYESVGL